MAAAGSSVISLKKLIAISYSKPINNIIIQSTHKVKLSVSASCFQFRIMNMEMHCTTSKASLSSSCCSSSYGKLKSSVVIGVPGLNSDEMEGIAGRIMEKYSLKMRRRGEGTAIVWFRNDLRLLDNECVLEAWTCSQALLPVYCVDPRIFHSSTTHHFSFPKTGALRAQFIMECLSDLKNNLMKRGLNLLIAHGKPEQIIPSLAQAFSAHTVYAHKETCSEELHVERSVSRALHQVKLSSDNSTSSFTPNLRLVWGTTLYHIDDLPFSAKDIPDVYTQFRKSVEAKCGLRRCLKIPIDLSPPPPIEDWGCIPSIHQLALQPQQATFTDKGMRFIGGETAALSRVYEYFWKKDLLKTYKETRNGMLGPDYSTKFSPWLASGSISPRFIYEEVKRYEKERQANDSTYWVLFELIWRDYFRFLSVKYGNSLFHLGGPRKVIKKWIQDQRLFEAWRDGRTGYPLIDANLKELSTTGFMSNRGRQIVCSFLVRDMGIDWRMGAEWFETCLLDYDPCSNYGNWTYGAGVGNDPREDRYFSIPKQAHTYDPEGEYVAYWLPELQKLEKAERHFPGKSYMGQIVPLKYGNSKKHQGQDRAFGARPTNDTGSSKHTKWSKSKR